MENKELIIVGYGSYATDPAWQVVIDHAPQIYAVIGNPDSGPGAVVNLEWLALFKRLKAAGIKVIGYVPTTYGARALSQVRADLVKWRDWYEPNGTFFDECAMEKEKLEYYRAAVGHARALGQQAIVVGNFGTVPDVSLFDLMDISCVAETDQETYVTKPFPAWVFQKPKGRIYNIIYAVTNSAKVRGQIAQNNAGFWAMVTTVKKPGADGPEFDIKDIIWPTIGSGIIGATPPPPAPAVQPPSNSTENWSSQEIIKGLRAIGASSDATAADLVPLINTMVAENKNLKRGIVGLTNAQIVAEVARRLP